MARGSPILIIGGGIAGLALSAALKQIGLSADLIERTRHSEPVGAEGVHSAIRNLLFGPTPPVYGEQMVWRSLSRVRLGLDSVQFWLGNRCFFGLCPVASGTYGFANVSEPRRFDAVQGRLQRLRERFAGFGGLVR